jgi:DNA-binding transcriptional LysR family regulator
VGATNEPPAIPGLRWFKLGSMEWVFAVAARHPLARAEGPISREQLSTYRSVVVADSSRTSAGRAYGVIGGQPTLAVPHMQAKILAQCHGLGVGWVPRQRDASLLKSGALVGKSTVDPREPTVSYVAWRGDREGRALQWWLEQLRQPRLAKRLVRGVDVTVGA